jgi:hypothetical protein
MDSAVRKWRRLNACPVHIHLFFFSFAIPTCARVTHVIGGVCLLADTARDRYRRRHGTGCPKTLPLLVLLTVCDGIYSAVAALPSTLLLRVCTHVAAVLCSCTLTMHMYARVTRPLHYRERLRVAMVVSVFIVHWCN